MSLHTISAGGYTAEVREYGGALVSMEYNGRTIVERDLEGGKPAFFGGDILAPWPNRLRDGEYIFNGKRYQAFVNEEKWSTALHGLVFDLQWKVVDKSENFISLATTLDASEAYPTSLDFLVSYELTSDGLIWTIQAENVGEDAAPYGVSVHPYLIADSSASINDCTLSLTAGEYMTIDDRHLPIELDSVRGVFDFNGGAVIGDRYIDAAFNTEPSPRIELTAPSGLGVWMEGDENSLWVQIHTADRDGHVSGRKSLAVEPMTCAADAFNTEDGLLIIEPGEFHVIEFRIGSL